MRGISRPSRYGGVEINPYGKEGYQKSLKVALAFPEVYEIGMSHYGFLLLYDMLKNSKEFFVDRAFAPWVDREKELRDMNSFLGGHETGLKLKSFDVVAFSLAYELSLTNALNMLDLGNIPIRSEKRGEEDPIVIAGGALTGNPEPFSLFFDAIFIGEGEEGLFEILHEIEKGVEGRYSRKMIVESLSRLESVYVPGIYIPRHDDEGNLAPYEKPEMGAPVIARRVVRDLDSYPLPTSHISPSMRVIHDRLGIEISRGCTRGCRFCQAGYYYRPLRERGASTILKYLEEKAGSSGFDEVGFLSLSSSDYSCINELIRSSMEILGKDMISISLPSLRINSINEEMVKELKKVRKSGFTIAPEAGSRRLRKVINKDISDEEILRTVEWILKNGWSGVKMYFMIGLPGERDEDIGLIADLAARSARLARRQGRKKNVTLSVSTFVPKPHTPFQWAPQIGILEMERKIRLLRDSISGTRNITFKWNSPKISWLEGILSRGDRKCGDLIEKAFLGGARFDGWSDRIDLDIWVDAMRGLDIDPERYTGERELTEFLPWEIVDTGIQKSFLLKEWEKSIRGDTTPDCRTEHCSGCGICNRGELENIFSEPLPVAPGPIERGPDIQGEPYGYVVAHRKVGGAALQSALEIQSLLLRAVRRGRIPVKYSGGFNPRPKISFPSALPVGVQSRCEFFFITLTEEITPEKLQGSLASSLPKELSPLWVARKTLKISMLTFREQFLVTLSDFEDGEGSLDNIFEKVKAIPEVHHVDGSGDTIKVTTECAAGRSPAKIIRETILTCTGGHGDINIVKDSSTIFAGKGDDRRKIHPHQQQAI